MGRPGGECRPFEGGMYNKSFGLMSKKRKNVDSEGRPVPMRFQMGTRTPLGTGVEEFT